jgi:5-methylcytosine-specific restriction protein A
VADWPYNTTTWQKVRKQILVRDRHRCQLQLKGCIGTANTVDHRLEVTAGGAPFDPHNLQAACNPCNSAKAGYRRGGTIVGIKPSRDW